MRGACAFCLLLGAAAAVFAADRPDAQAAAGQAAGRSAAQVAALEHRVAQEEARSREAQRRLAEQDARIAELKRRLEAAAKTPQK